jgi:putative transposase
VAGSPRPGSLVAGSPHPGPSGAGKPRPYVVNMPPENNLTHPPTLGQIVAFFKYQTTKHVNQIRGTPGAPIWQRNYWERIVRNGDELSRIREYIRNNPVAWETDDEYPHPH